MISLAPALSDDRRVSGRWAILPLALAIFVGAPTIRGGFLTGDDVQLIRDHVLVNRPSLDHLVKLFSVPHRDLYQPVPLATFSLEFGVMRWFGLTPSADGPRTGAWICHAGNVLIHAFNAFLVFAVIRRLARDPRVALVAACLFAIHPLNVECIAWLNGRMIMLSTLFTLAALLAADTLLQRPSLGLVCVVILMALLAMMSKISVGLPALLLLLPWVQRLRPSPRWWVAFIGATVVTLLFVSLTVSLSRPQLAAAQDALHGSRWARTLIAVSWYLRNYLVPTGLSPWHPADLVVTFADPRILLAALMLAALLIVCGIVTRFTRQGGAVLIWFFATLAPTLPLVPSRNVLVAQRYLYLPGVALHWLVGLLAVALAGRLAKRCKPIMSRALGAFAALAVAVPLVIFAWRTAAHYRDNVARYRRISALYPDRNEVWPPLAWSLFEAGRYEEAVQAAEIEFHAVQNPARSDVYQVQGMALLRAGKVAEALAQLEAAVTADPKDERAYFRLATAQAENGKLEEAADNFRKSVELAPTYNHALIGLGRVSRALHCADEAAQAFQKALDNNPYDPIAAVALAEIELDRGQVREAAGRLEKLLHWMPENAGAHTNLGVCYLRLGRKPEALREFRASLARDPATVEPRLNLAQLLAQSGEADEAAWQFELLVRQTGHTNLAVLESYSDFLISRNDLHSAAALWTRALASRPNDAPLIAWHAWVSALAEQWDLAARSLTMLPGDSQRPGAAALAEIMVSVHTNKPESAIDAVSKLVGQDAEEARGARTRLRAALRDYSTRHADNPWPYYLMILMLKADGEFDAARLGLKAFEELCPDESWRQRARSLLHDPRAPATQPTAGLLTPRGIG